MARIPQNLPKRANLSKHQSFHSKLLIACAILTVIILLPQCKPSAQQDGDYQPRVRAVRLQRFGVELLPLALFRPPYYLLANGFVTNGGIQRSGREAYWWSQRGANGEYGLMAYIVPDQMYPYTGDSPYYGESVRCLLPGAL